MTVVDMRSGEPFDIRIDRATKYGNPYTHENHVAEKREDVILVGSREEAVLKYAGYLVNQIKLGQITLQELAKLDGKRLGCWCPAPLPCHGWVLELFAKVAKSRKTAY